MNKGLDSEHVLRRAEKKTSVPEAISLEDVAPEQSS